MSIDFDPELLREPGAVFLDTAREADGRRSSHLFRAPQHTLVARRVEEVPRVLNAVDAAVAGGAYAVGYLSYEAGYAFEKWPETPALDEPVAWFGLYRAPVDWAPEDVLDGWCAWEGGPAVGSAPELAVEEEQYVGALRQIRQRIAEGDVYQINFTTPSCFDFQGDPLALYRRLRSQQRVAYGAYLNLGARHVLSASPELFFRREGNRLITRPMKGTIRRGRTLEEDAKLQRELRKDAKTQAENLMIVDLLRNDLSVVCRPGSVEVPELFTVEPYESVNQMTSTVTGTLGEDVTYSNIFEALFPCGSVTGAPKLRAMKRIRELEEGPRGVYCGAIGYITPNEEASFSVAIRTVELRDGKGRMGTGSGVVWDSDPHAEYQETKLKTAFLQEALKQDGADEPLHLIETMRCENGRIDLLDRHLDRLGESAQYFGYPHDPETIRSRLTEICERIGSECVHKIRLTLHSTGSVQLGADPIEEEADHVLGVMLATERIDPGSPYRYHKTSRRKIYRRAYDEARSHGFDEAILRNGEGYVTEGTRTSIFLRFGRKWRTPTIWCGVLPGVYRSYLLDRLQNVEEARLTPADVAAADEIWCCNALRGVRRAEFHPDLRGTPVM